MLNKEQTDFLLVNAYNAAVRAGARIIDIYTGDADYGVDLKSDHTPITIADRESHELIKNYLSQTRIPLLSEEGRDLLYEERRNWDLFWMVDPLDGTKEFLKGNGEFTVNIALMCDNEPYIGIIYVPYIRRIYFAQRGVGSYLKTDVRPDGEASFDLTGLWSDSVRLPLRECANEPIRIAVSRSHNTDETFEHVARIKSVHPDAEVIEQGSSYKFCLLAEGAVEVYVRTSNTYEWDTAAGEVILSEAGGVVEPFGGGTGMQYNKTSLLRLKNGCRRLLLRQTFVTLRRNLDYDDYEQQEESGSGRARQHEAGPGRVGRLELGGFAEASSDLYRNDRQDGRENAEGSSRPRVSGGRRGHYAAQVGSARRRSAARGADRRGTGRGADLLLGPDAGAAARRGRQSASTDRHAV